MPATFPTTVTYRALSIALIDGSGDKRSVSMRVRGDITEAQALAVATALGAASQANVYEVTLGDVYAAAPDAGDALDFERDSVYENIVILFKNIATGQTQNAFIPAPVPATMVGETDTPDTDNALYEAFRDAVDAALPAAFEPISARYTERREINDARVPA